MDRPHNEAMQQFLKVTDLAPKMFMAAPTAMTSWSSTCSFMLRTRMNRPGISSLRSIACSTLRWACSWSSWASSSVENSAPVFSLSHAARSSSLPFIPLTLPSVELLPG